MTTWNEAGMTWTTTSLAYARSHGRARLVGLLETVRAEIVLDTELYRRQALAQREERRRARQEAQSQARAAAWDSFMAAERRELLERKNGCLARMLGGPLPGESPAALQRLAQQDQRQAEQGLVALMKGGKVVYKRLEDLSEGDMPCREAANRLRTTWLKERRDGWLNSRKG